MKILKKLMIVSGTILLAVGIAGWAFVSQDKFGRSPSGARLGRVLASPNYSNGAFRNQLPTPMMVDSAGFFSTAMKFIFGEKERNRPDLPVSSIKTDLRALDPAKNLIVWLGHSSYYMQLDGKRYLIDPVLSGSASPVSFMIKPFLGADIYSPDDIPEIDFLIITHDHWDHLDYRTLKSIQGRVIHVVCPLGVGEHLELWGFPSEMVSELDWYESAEPCSGFRITSCPARHFSGRLLKRNQTLWSAYAVETPSVKIFCGGDGGYGPHFAEIGDRFSGFDLAVLECGQYNQNWRLIHSLPEELPIEAKDLRAAAVLPVHNSKFALAMHEWDEPQRKCKEYFAGTDTKLLSPIIGEVTEIGANP